LSNWKHKNKKSPPENHIMTGVKPYWFCSDFYFYEIHNSISKIEKWGFIDGPAGAFEQEITVMI
jgi:hypothetical protein